MLGLPRRIWMPLGLIESKTMQNRILFKVRYWTMLSLSERLQMRGTFLATSSLQPFERVLELRGPDNLPELPSRLQLHHSIRCPRALFNRYLLSGQRRAMHFLPNWLQVPQYLWSCSPLWKSKGVPKLEMADCLQILPEKQWVPNCRWPTESLPTWLLRVLWHGILLHQGNEVSNGP